jgi:hypothetical protein
MAALPAALQRAILATFDECRRLCDERWVEAACLEVRVAEQLNDLVVGDFRAAPCPFDAGGAPALAVPQPDGTVACLTFLGAAEDYWKSADPENADPARVCPRAVLARERDGAVTTEDVALPKYSFLQNVRFCCAAVDLAIDAGGRIEAVPTENPPEDCLFGHRGDVLQEIFRLRHTALLMTHRLPLMEE